MGYYQATINLGLLCHKWLPILFVLIVDGFGIEYVGNRNIRHLR